MHWRKGDEEIAQCVTVTEKDESKSLDGASLALLVRPSPNQREWYLDGRSFLMQTA
mgnify:CR=1 FL=1